MVFLVLTSCEGSTDVTHHVSNATSDTLILGIRLAEHQVGWYEDTVHAVPPGETHVQYTLYHWGKCHDCSAYEVAPYGLDSLWIEGVSPNVSLMDSSLWVVDVDEGLNWIRFDQRLAILPSMLD
ncbi:MAG: hypothetical protein ACPG66_01810 [Flavobacteriales bacterium]